MTKCESYHAMRPTVKLSEKRAVSMFKTYPPDVTISVALLPPLPLNENKAHLADTNLFALKEENICQAFPEISETCNELKIIINTYMDQHFGNKEAVTLMLQNSSQKKIIFCNK